MFKHYKKMSKNNKVVFWQVITNLFLVVFTFWMGLFVQDFIASKNASVNERLLQMQYNEKVYPKYVEVEKHEFLDKIYRIVHESKSNQDSIDAKFAALWLGCNLILYSDTIDSIARRNVSIMNEYRYYCLDKSQSDSITVNNAAILLFLKTKELIRNDSIKKSYNDFKKEFQDYIFSSDFRLFTINMAQGDKKQTDEIINKCWEGYQKGDELACTAAMIRPFIQNQNILRSSFEIIGKPKNSLWQFSNWNTTPWQILGLGIVLLFIIINVFIYVFIPGKDMEKTLSYEDLEEELRQQKLYDIAIFQGKNREINEKTEIINKQNDRINEQNKVISDKIRTINELREKLKKYEGE